MKQMEMLGKKKKKKTRLYRVVKNTQAQNKNIQSLGRDDHGEKNLSNQKIEKN